VPGAAAAPPVASSTRLKPPHTAESGLSEEGLLQGHGNIRLYFIIKYKA
jgi:hypothetical protein